MNSLPYAIYLSFAGASLALTVGSGSVQRARWIALLTAFASWGLVLIAATHFQPTHGLRTLVDVPWIDSMGIRYHLAVDGISLSLLVLTGLAATAGVLFSWNLTERA